MVSLCTLNLPIKIERLFHTRIVFSANSKLCESDNDIECLHYTEDTMMRGNLTAKNNTPHTEHAVGIIIRFIIIHSVNGYRRSVRFLFKRSPIKKSHGR